MFKIARTISDLAGCEQIQSEHIAVPIPINFSEVEIGAVPIPINRSKAEIGAVQASHSENK